MWREKTLHYEVCSARQSNRGKLYDTVDTKIRAEIGNHAIVKSCSLHKATVSWRYTMKMVDESLKMKPPLLISN